MTASKTDWDGRFFNMARLVASWSKDPSTKVGCVLVNSRRRVVGLGYNGFPEGVQDLEERYNDRPLKYLMTQHAEANALNAAVHSTVGCTAYVTHPPCAQCAGQLIQRGITRVVSTRPDDALWERFKESFVAARTMLAEADVTVSYRTPTKPLG